MKEETVVRIDDVLSRLDAGGYGFCVVCEGEIAERRLLALPFASRCHSCEQRREDEQERARQRAQRRGEPSLFADAIGM
jgi:RNA polymerase-binding transcription factor DksA